MGADQRVYRAGRLARVGDVLEAFAQFARAVAARVVAALQRHDRALQVGGQRVVGFVHVREAGVAAGRRDLDCVKQAADRRQFVVRHIRVPLRLVVAEVADRLAVDLDVGHYGDFGIRVFGRVALGVDGRLVEFTEPAGEGKEPRVVQMLTAKPKYQVLMPSVLDCFEGRLIDGLAEIDAGYVGAQAGAGRLDLDARSGWQVHRFLL